MAKSKEKERQEKVLIMFKVADYAGELKTIFARSGYCHEDIKFEASNYVRAMIEENGIKKAEEELMYMFKNLDSLENLVRENKLDINIYSNIINIGMKRTEEKVRRMIETKDHHKEVIDPEPEKPKAVPSYLKDLHKPTENKVIGSVFLGLLILLGIICSLALIYKYMILGIEYKPTQKETPCEVMTLERDTEKLKYLGEFKLTGYCPCELCCGPYASGITATGTEATEGRTIAVDPNVIPLGSHVIIDGHEYIAEDTGSAVNNKVIDIFKNNHEDCYSADCNGYHEVWLVEE